MWCVGRELSWCKRWHFRGGDARRRSGRHGCWKDGRAVGWVASWDRGFLTDNVDRVQSNNAVVSSNGTRDNGRPRVVVVGPLHVVEGEHLRVVLNSGHRSLHAGGVGNLPAASGVGLRGTSPLHRPAFAVDVGRSAANFFARSRVTSIVWSEHCVVAVANVDDSED
jgi:hypothetical protein